ncbi:MAG: hypothetical protein IJK92_00035 [Bacteroidales bacterium]|nr:hypothetical protein [Bacteroidales bacterium]
MKKLLLLIAVVAMVLTGCVKNLDKYGFSDTTLIKGRVIEESDHTPISGVNVSVTNGARTYASYNTSADGYFEMEVNFNDIDKDYYLLLSGQGKNKKYSLKGMGQEMYDYRDVSLYRMLATFECDEVFYEVYPTDFGPATFNDAKQNVANLEYGGYDDWGLPSLEALKVMYAERNIIGGFGANKYWSGLQYYDYNGGYYVDFSTGESAIYYGDNIRYYYRPIRISTFVSVTPKVTTADPIMTGTTVTTGGNIISDGGETVTARGVCYGTQPYPDKDGDHTIDGCGTGQYSSTFTITQDNIMYYIRAYATNANGTSYGEQKTITKLNLPTFQYNGSTYYVAPDPGNKMNHSNAVSYCDNYGIYGTTGWTLPTIGELTQMYANKTSIGGFTSDYYHSSTEAYSYYANEYYYVINFSNGESGNTYNYSQCRVRPIKKIN